MISSKPAMPTDRFKLRLTSILGHAHLIYLCLLPTLSTFAVLYVYGHPVPLLLFIGGTAAVGVYLAVTVSYTRPSKSIGWALLVLFDGPVWALLSVFSKDVTSMGFAIEGFLVDGVAIWLSILILALHSEKPTRRQRIASVGFMLVALAATLSLIWPYYRDNLNGEWLSLGLLAAGILEAAIVHSKVLKKDEVIRDSDTTAGFIIVFILLWVGSMNVGNVLHEYKIKRERSHPDVKTSCHPRPAALSTYALPIRSSNDGDRQNRRAKLSDARAETC